MAKGNKKITKEKKSSVESATTPHIQKETLQGIFAVLFFVLAIFFVLSSPTLFGGTGKAGPAGEMVFKLFSFLFGTGY
jgi:hypothetical protein